MTWRRLVLAVCTALPQQLVQHPSALSSLSLFLLGVLLGRRTIHIGLFLTNVFLLVFLGVMMIHGDDLVVFIAGRFVPVVAVDQEPRMGWLADTKTTGHGQYHHHAKDGKERLHGGGDQWFLVEWRDLIDLGGYGIREGRGGTIQSNLVYSCILGKTIIV